MTVTKDEMYGRDALHKRQPWITPEALAFLEKYQEGLKTVFEWGSGGSTLWWIDHGMDVITVEGKEKWAARLSSELVKGGLQATMLYIPQDEKAQTWHNYADAILNYSTFDIVYIDGEATARKRSLKHALDKVNPGGMLVLDNSNWYDDTLDTEQWERHDFAESDLQWVGKKETFTWQTTILLRK